MKHGITRRIMAAAAFLLLVMTAASAASAVKVPVWSGPVNDQAGIISSSDETKLEKYLNAIEDQTGIEIAVLTVKSLDGTAIEAYSLAVAEEWKLGQKNKDNGVLMVVAFEEHDIRIEVGYGLEGDLTDAKCGLIMRTVMIPLFKEGNYSKGILSGAQAVGKVVAPEVSDSMEGISSSGSTSSDDEDIADGIAGFIFFLLFVVFMISLSNRRSRYRRYNPYGFRRRSGLSQAAETLFWLNMLNNGSHHNSGGFGGGHSGGFGGGGFSGGGGHFGGGGATGHW